jgi:Tfp pilus assembly protein PilF
VWQTQKMPEAANNLAYLIARTAPTDQTMLQEARQAMEAALGSTATRPAASVPAGTAAVLDTYGWILHLQGKDQEAVQQLRSAVKGLPDVLEVHYHLGMVERQLGEQTMARWHLAEAVRLGATPVANPDSTSGKERARVVKEAQEALAALPAPS